MQQPILSKVLSDIELRNYSEATRESGRDFPIARLSAKGLSPDTVAVTSCVRHGYGDLARADLRR